MQKEALFYRNNYLTEFEATVVDCIEENGKVKVILSETAFYPEGGGQPADTGEISGVKVIHVEEKNGVIYHIVDEPIESGKRVFCKINFEKRFANMQNHSGEHIVSGIICSMFNADNVGFHMGKDCVTMDFNTIISDEQLREIELKANEAIYKNIEINSRFISEEESENIEFRSKKELKGDIRLVEVPGFDICACCGIHVTRTGEIGVIKLLSADKYKAGVRISMLTGKRALENYTEVYNELNKISTSLSLKHIEAFNGVTELKLELDNIKKDRNRINNELFDYKLNKIDTKENLVLVEDDLSSGDIKILCEKLKSKVTQIAGVFSKNINGYSFMIVSDSINLQNITTNLREKFRAKCGGKTNVIQGQFEGNIDEIKLFIEKYKE